MLSTTDRVAAERARGQTIVLFALSLVVLLAMAALAFDVGQVMLAKRAQQNAADAAALAGARYIAASNCKSNPSLSNIDCRPAVDAALRVAQLNGYGDGSTNCASACGSMDPKVTVKIPPGPEAAEYDGVAGALEVQIASRESSVFAGVLGIANWNVGSGAVAANQVDVAMSFSFLALDPTGCGSVKLTGSNGSGLTAGGNVVVDSTCSTGLQVSGNAQITVTSGACDVSGPGYQQSGNATVNCTVNTNQPAVPDPLGGLPAPAVPPLAPAPMNLDTPAVAPPPNCPSSLTAPQTCQFPNRSAYAGTHWRLFPGTYPGGLSLQSSATFYLEPGIYYIAGGGITVNGGGPVVMSVASGGTTPGGGVMIYNTTDTTASCASYPAACGGSITLDGSSATVTLYPYQSDPYAGIVIFQDRTLNATVKLTGSSSNLTIDGTIYAPDALVQVNGSNSTAASIGSAQVIAYDFQFNGSGGNMNVGYDANSFFHVRGSGLVK